MADTYVLTKLLDVREKEKKDAQKAYEKSLHFFEEVATRLYTLLKKKENAEASYERYLTNTVPLNKIKGQLTYIQQLNRQIMTLQKDVQTARRELEKKQQTLTDAYVEVKKFEKIIEHRKLKQENIRKKQELQAMDEASVQQFLYGKNR